MSDSVDSGDLKQPVNLIYVRAAVEAATGVSVPLETLRLYLVQEGLITPGQARHKCPIFSGYDPFFSEEDFSVDHKPLNLQDDVLL